MCSGDPNLRPHTLIASTLPDELSPQLNVDVVFTVNFKKNNNPWDKFWKSVHVLCDQFNRIVQIYCISQFFVAGEEHCVQGNLRKHVLEMMVLEG